MAQGDDTVLSEYSHLQDEFTVLGGYEFRNQTRRVLKGLGFSEADFQLPFKALSGGQRTRLMLALVLLKEADLLLLDEPENHLDLEARAWLEGFLRDCASAVVLISHDRQMLNTVAGRILELERGAVWGHRGNYQEFLAQKALVRDQQIKTYERQQEMIRKEEAWIDRFRYKTTKARQVQSRIKRLEKMTLHEAPDAQTAQAKFHLGEVVRSGAVALEGAGLSMAYGDQVLYQEVAFKVQRGQRVGVIGPNGSGKTTLLRHIAGQLDRGEGQVKLGHKVTLGYYEQNHESLNPANDILSEVQLARPDWNQERLRSFLGQLLFTGEEVFKKISALSGGELSRVAMAKLMLGDANLLLLDEPTNHLDIPSREALEAALVDFPGTLVLASHDRALLNCLVDTLFILEAGGLRIFPGSYAEYCRDQQQTVAAEEAQRQEEVLRIRRNQEQREAKKAQERQERRTKRKLAELETQIETLEDRLGAYDQAFSEVDPSDYERLQALTEEYEGKKAALAALYQAWEAVAEGE